MRRSRIKSDKCCPYYTKFGDNMIVCCGNNSTYLCQFCDPVTKSVDGISLEDVRKEIEWLLKKVPDGNSKHPWRYENAKKNKGV